MATELVELDRAGNAVRGLIRDYGRIPDELRKRLTPAMRSAAQPVLGDARRRSSWSRRIPASLRLAVSFTRRRAGVSLVADRHKAPHARAYEGIRGNATFRHMVFGDREQWVTQQTRPFAAPAVDLHGRRVVDAVNQTVTEAARAAGFGRSS